MKKRAMKDKFYFPELSKAIVANGWTNEDFKSRAYAVAKSPGSKTWSHLMSESKGATETYAVRARNILEKLDFDSSVYRYKKCQ